MSKSADLIKTNHPYIMQSHDICSGSPVLEGTRTRVIDIAIEYTMLGRSPDEIIDAHPYLDLAKVRDALSYYYEHREEMDAEIQMRIQDIEELRAKIQSNEKLLEAINAAYDDFPDEEEQSLLRQMRHRHRLLVEERNN